VVTSLVAQHMYALPPYAFMAKDYTTRRPCTPTTSTSLASLMVGAFAHGAIFLIRDYDPAANKNNVLTACWSTRKRSSPT
jgi:photosystem I P700 chlorophyll a apoprotein A2